NELDNVANRLYALTPAKGGWQRQALPETARFCSVSAKAVDADESDDYFMTVSGYLTPSTLYFGKVGEKSAEKLKETPPLFNANGLEVTQDEAVSKDGTKIPYFRVAREGMKRNGLNPTLIYGYGGFEIALTPRYDAGTGAAWLEKGGVYVVANI